MASARPGSRWGSGCDRLRHIACGAIAGHLSARPSVEHHPMRKPAGPALLALNFEARLEGRIPLEAYTLPVVQRPGFGEPVPVRSPLSAIRKK